MGSVLPARLIMEPVTLDFVEFGAGEVFVQNIQVVRFPRPPPQPNRVVDARTLYLGRIRGVFHNLRRRFEASDRAAVRLAREVTNRPTDLPTVPQRQQQEQQREQRRG